MVVDLSSSERGVTSTLAVTVRVYTTTAADDRVE